MDTSPLMEIIGWIGSALVVLSLAQARVLRFRVMNFAGAVLATVYNGALQIWPFAAMNGIIAVIDAYWLVRLYREAQPETTAFEVVPTNPQDGFLRHFLNHHAEDVQKHFPDFDPDSPREHAFLVMRRDEAVGVVSIGASDEDTATLDLDYVTERFRDFAPGQFVYRDSGVFKALGVTRIVAPRMSDTAYLQKMGFTRQGDDWVLAVS